jgi:hypothetical protein
MALQLLDDQRQAVDLVIGSGSPVSWNGSLSGAWLARRSETTSFIRVALLT